MAVQLVKFCLIYVIATCESVKYNRENGLQPFRYQMKKFNKHYASATAKKEAFNNFIRNLNDMSELNKKHGSLKTLYIPGIYADLDPQEIEERYAIHIKPYMNAKDPKEPNLLGHVEGKFIEDTFLYDLTNAELLYDEFVKKYGKKLSSRSHERLKRYLRFVKTLVEINRTNFKGKQRREVEKDADVIKNSTDFFYPRK